MIQSKIFLPIITRASINSDDNPRMNFSLLANDSPCDNVLLEYKLSLELLARGLLSFVYPVLVGDVVSTADGESVYSDYFQSGCYPEGSDDVYVDAVEQDLVEHLSRLCLGTALVEERSVRQTLAEITKRQGGLMGPCLHSIVCINRNQLVCV